MGFFEFSLFFARKHKQIILATPCLRHTMFATLSYMIIAPAIMTAEKDQKKAAFKCFESVGLDPDSYRIGHTKARYFCFWINFISFFVFRSSTTFFLCPSFAVSVNFLLNYPKTIRPRLIMIMQFWESIEFVHFTPLLHIAEQCIFSCSNYTMFLPHFSWIILENLSFVGFLSSINWLCVCHLWDCLFFAHARPSPMRVTFHQPDCLFNSFNHLLFVNLMWTPMWTIFWFPYMQLIGIPKNTTNSTHNAQLQNTRCTGNSRRGRFAESSQDNIGVDWLGSWVISSWKLKGMTSTYTHTLSLSIAPFASLVSLWLCHFQLFSCITWHKSVLRRASPLDRNQYRAFYWDIVHLILILSPRTMIAPPFTFHYYCASPSTFIVNRIFAINLHQTNCIRLQDASKCIHAERE